MLIKYCTITSTVEWGYFNPWRVTLTHSEKQDLEEKFDQTLNFFNFFTWHTLDVQLCIYARLRG